eukprot:TRINITY_DN4012_c0_g1_i1.p1 TRINITY_DN4012_c0_g1~~TRINITY_DN4012_c0_g1_i1.p1  ORF type:complete len:268 (-),score=44.91 TRINITY_DN4012_c0_g1_i1:60-863(-)
MPSLVGSEMCIRDSACTSRKSFQRVHTKVVNKNNLQTSQGLLFVDNDTLLESYGHYGESGIHFLNLRDMTVRKETWLDFGYFGEGCDLVKFPNGTQYIIQLTWREGIIFIYNTDLALQHTINLPFEIKEGWGITHRTIIDKDTKKERLVLLVTDGTDKIHTLDASTLSVLSTLRIKDENGNPELMLNEIEFIEGKLWVNIWLSDKVLILDPESGARERTLDFSKLRKEAAFRKSDLSERDDVLNGIAYHAETKRFLITGKKLSLIHI